MSMVYFTSDLHLGHQAILRMQNRPFGSIEEMNDTLIRNINSVVKSTDKLYILGDVSHHITPEETNDLIRRMRCRKYLILGNHDVAGDPEICPYDHTLFEWVGTYRKINTYGMNIVIMHYPMLSWPKAMAGSVMLHGHIHSDGTYNKANKEAGIRRFDVGVDANNYFPISIYQIKQFTEETPVSITSRDGLYIPGVWTGDTITLGKYASEHPDRTLEVHMNRPIGSSYQDKDQIIDNWKESEVMCQRKVLESYSLGNSIWKVVI